MQGLIFCAYLGSYGPSFRVRRLDERSEVKSVKDLDYKSKFFTDFA